MLDSEEKLLRKTLGNIAAAHGTCALLERISRGMLMPTSQKHEFRYLHIANMLLELPYQQGQPGTIPSLRTVLTSFEDLYGELFSPQEVDFIYIPFISWLNWRGNTYRTFSGTFAEPEIYLSDLIAKGASLDVLLKDKFGFAFSDVVDLLLPRMHRYIEECNLESQESVDSSNLLPPSLQEASVMQDNGEVWRRCFLIEKASLSENQIRVLSRLSRRPGQYGTDLRKLFMGNADIMRFPVVKVPQGFAIVCPQLVIPALLNSVAKELGRNHKLKTCLLGHLRTRLSRGLKRRFLDEPAVVLTAPSCDGQVLADLVVLYDRKLLLFSVVGEDLSLFRRLAQQHKIGAKTLADSRVRVLVSEKGEIKIGQGPVEFLHFFIVDTYTELELAVPEDEIPKNEIAEIVSIKNLELVLDETDDALHFIKFFRMRQRARSATKAIIEIGRPVLDSLAIFKQKKWLNPFAKGKPTLMVEIHSFGKYHLEQLVAFRQKNAVRSVNGEPKLWRIYYPGCLQRFESETIVSIIDLQSVVITIRGTFPSEEVEFKTWHVSLDSLCYHLSTKAKLWQERFRIFEPDLSSVEVSLEYHHHDSDPTSVAVEREENTLMVTMRISSEMRDVFSAGNNSGERLVVGTFVKGIGLVGTEEFDAILPASVERKSQLTKWRPPHESWNDGVEAIPLYECDEEVTIGTERKALLKTDKKPGTYRQKSDIYGILGHALAALRESLLEKIRMYDRDMLITFSYTQLEASYIANEVKKQELAFASQTAEFVNIEQEYVDTIKAGVAVSFAARLVLETAIQSDTSGRLPVTLEGFSDLTAFANQIMLLDSFGDQLGTLERAGCTLPAIELTERFTVKVHSDGDPKDELARFLFELQKGNIENPVTPPEAKEKTRKEFAEAFDEALLDEYGFSMSQRHLLDKCLLLLFSERSVPILTIERPKLIEYLLDKSGLAETVINSYLDRLTLSRELLQNIGQIKPSEKYWRDARILNRPLVCVEGETLVFAHTVVGLSSQVFAERLMKARTPSDSLDKNSNLSKAISQWANDRGEAFKNKIADFLRDQNWEINPEVKSFGDASMPAEGMGPLDLVCINRAQKKLLFVECKQNYFSRNAKDLRNELDYFFGHDKERGEFQRFVEKINWAHSSKDKIAKQYGLELLSEWNLSSVFVTSELLYCTVFRKAPIPVMNELEFRNQFLMQASLDS